MSEWREMFEYDGGADGLGSDFEARVFAKIRRKKQQRKIGYGITAAAAVALLLVLIQPFRSGAPRQPLTAVKKTEIPVSESLFFSTSDSQTRYSLQPVVLGSVATAPQTEPDQI